MDDFQFQGRGAAAAAAVLPGKVAAGRRAKPAACYDDVFGGQPRSSLVPARPDDYREIFGAAAACSIPVLDLPPPPGDGYELRQCSALDYLDIFGGFGSGDFAASYQELFASQGSNGIGVPLPSELGYASPVIGGSNSRVLNGMGCEKQEMPASGITIEGPSRDQFGCSLNGVAQHLNDGTNLLKRPNHMASWSNKSDPVDGTIHKNQVHAMPGLAFVVKNTDVDKPQTQVDIDVFFDSNCSSEVPEQHLKKAMLSTSSCSDVKCSENDMKDEQRPTNLELSGSMITSSYKENTSYPSKNQSMIPRSNGFSAKVSTHPSPGQNSMEKKTEGKCQNKTVLNSMSATSGNDLKVRCTASEGVPVNEEYLSSSSNGHSASNGTKSSPDHLPDDVTIYAGNIKIAEANHLKKSMPGSPPCTTQNSDDKTADQKKSNPMSNPPKNATINESIHSCSSSTHSVSGLDRSCPDSIFLTISDINLRTQPSQGPPPARPPSRSDLSGRNLRRTLTDYQKHDVGTGIAYRSHSFKHSMRDSSPPPFDVEVDASSAAAASVAAIKEAMELAQARLKSAKVSRERQKDNLLSRRKLGLNEDLSDLNRDRHQNFQDTQRIREEVFVELAHEKTDDQKNASTAEKMPTAFNPSLPTGDFKEKEKNHESAEVSLPAIHCGESEVSSLTNIKQDKVGEWKVEEQFYEFIQSEEKLKKVPENSLKEDTERRSQTKIGIGGKELNAFELKKCEKLLAATKVVEWEGDNVRPQNCCVTSKEQIEGSQVASLMYNRPENCNLRQKETIDAHLQEKQPGEFQEPLKTEQETKWRTSEEAFICELSEKNLGVSNDASKCKSVYRCQAQEKVHRGTDETSGCEETEKEINVADEYFDGHEEDNIVQGKLSEVVGNKMEANVVLVSNISAKDVHLKTVSKNHGCEIHRVSLNTDEYGCFPEGQEIEPKEASPLFGRGKGNISNSTCQVFEWAVNEDELKAPVNVHDWKDKRDNFNVPQGTNRCSDEANKLNEIQKFAVETEEELQLKTVKLNTSSIAGVKGDFGNETAAALEDCNKKIYENIKEVQVVGSNKIVKPTQNVRKGTGNDKKIEDAQEADSLGEQWHMCKASQMSSGNQDAGMPVENGSCGHETEDIDGDKMEDEQVNDLEEGKEREIRKLEEEIEKKRIELEEKEREKKLEDAKERERISLKEEKEREKKLGEEKERTRLEEERERERKKLEGEREKKMLEDEEREQKLQEEERKRKKLEDEDREKKRLEDEEREKKLEVQERKRKKLEDEEREKKRLEDWEREKNLEEEERKRRNLEDERERKRLEEENERRRSEEEEREWRKCEEAEERRKLEEEKRKLEEERERRKFEEEERERRKTEEKERMRKKQEEEDRERSKLEEKERERRKQEEERERRRLEEIERERRKLEEKVRERQKIEEEKAREKKLDEEREEWRKSEEEKERERKKLEVERDREREREKDRQAVERATREAHERAFIEARERAERVAVERITAEARQRALAEARERAEKSSAEALEKYMAEKVSREARLRSERAAVERATAEARERAAEKAAQDARERAEKLATASREGVRQNFSNVRDFDPQFQNVGPSNSSYQKYSDSSHNASFMNEKFRGSEGESAIRCKARMERHQRTFERAAKALAEKNLRDIIAQREQAERHRLAETLDADVKRWSNGKEGNLRALLSTLQYILGPESGWQPIPLTDVVTAPAVKKAYRKATLCVHPDKLQQRGASIQQKYICEKVFDLLKEAWNKFNSEER